MTCPDEPLPPSAQKLELCNDSGRPIEVMVEFVPNRYVLQPSDTLVLIATAENVSQVEGLTLNIYDGGIWISPAWDVRPKAYINGRIAEADWTTPAYPGDSRCPPISPPS